MTHWPEEPFELFRTALFVSLATYYGLTTTIAIIRLTQLLRGTDPRKRLLRVYLSYQVASIRIRPLLGELLQIGFWVAILFLIWWWHPAP
jgi:hypothetical protein